MYQGGALGDTCSMRTSNFDPLAPADIVQFLLPSAYLRRPSPQGGCYTTVDFIAGGWW